MAIELIPISQEKAAQLSQHVAQGITRVPGLYRIETKNGVRYYRGEEFWRSLSVYLMRQIGIRLVCVKKTVADASAQTYLRAVSNDGEQIEATGNGYAPDNSYQSFKSAEARDKYAWAQTRADRVAWRDMFTALMTWQGKDAGEFEEDSEPETIYAVEDDAATDLAPAATKHVASEQTPTAVPGVSPLPAPVKIPSKQNGGNGTGDALTKLRELEAKFADKTYTEKEQRELKQQIVFALKSTAIGDDGDLRHALRVELFGEEWGWHQLEALKLWLMSEGAKKYVANFVAKRVAPGNADAQAVPSKQQITPEQIGMIVKALSQSHGGDIDAAAHAADEMFRKKFGYAMNRGTSEDYEAVMQEIEKDPTYIPF